MVHFIRIQGTTYVKFNYLAKVVSELSAIENCRFVSPPISCLPWGVRGSKWAHQYLIKTDATVFLLGTSGPKRTLLPHPLAGFLSSFDFLTQKLMFYWYKLTIENDFKYILFGIPNTRFWNFFVLSHHGDICL